MRRIVNSTYASLDGVIENPHLCGPATRTARSRGPAPLTEFATYVALPPTLTTEAAVPETCRTS